MEGCKALGLGILHHVKLKHGHANAPTVIEMMHDIFDYFFNGKGRPGKRKGYKEDFSKCDLPAYWDVYTDRLGDGQKVDFPVIVRKFLSWGPKSHHLVNGSLVPKPRIYQEKVSICFNTTAHSVN